MRVEVLSEGVWLFLYELYASGFFGGTYSVSTMKFYATASPSQHYQIEFLTLPSLGQHSKKFLFTIL